MIYISYTNYTAEDESNLIRNIQVLLINCVINMHSFFGISISLFFCIVSVFNIESFKE